MGCPEDKNDAQRAESMVSRMFKARTIMVVGQVDEELAQRVVSELVVLDAESHDPIKVIVTSQGGHVDSGFAIHDMMRFVRSEVLAIGAGWVASIGVPILFGARKENRFALPNTRFLLHQPSGGVGGHVKDIRIEAQEILKIRERINRLIAEETGQPIEKVAGDSDRNFWMTAEEAVKYGVVSKIISNVSELD